MPAAKDLRAVQWHGGKDPELGSKGKALAGHAQHPCGCEC